jgi:hypothetical protein
MNNQPIKIDSLEVFRENNFPIQIDFDSPELIETPVEVELWSNGEYFATIDHEISGDMLSFETSVEQHREVFKAAIYVKMVGEYKYTFPLEITMDGAISAPQTRTITAPSVGTVRVSTYSDVATAKASQAAIDAATRAEAAADRADLGLIPKGPWNPVTNTPTLAATPDPTFVDGSAYDISATGTMPFAGRNFTTGKAVKSSDTLKKMGTQWYLIEFQIGAGSVNESALAQGSVSANKTDFLTPEKNMFNVLETGNILGKYINESTGAEVTSSSHNTTHLIPVVAGSSYAVSSNGATVTARMIWYNASGVFISGNLGNTASRVAPAGAVSLRVSVNHTSVSWTLLQVEAAAAATAFSPYRLILKASKGIPILADGLRSDASLLASQLGYNRGKNLFDKSHAENLIGFFISNTTGTITSSSVHRTTHFIDINEAVSFSVSSSTIGTLRVIYYNAAKAFISGYLGTTMPQVTPTGTKFIRVSISTDTTSWDFLQVELGVATRYESFGFKIKQIQSKPVSITDADHSITSEYAQALSNEAILTAPQLGYTQTSNIFNVNDAENLNDKFISESTGAISTLSGYKTSHFIKVSPGDVLSISATPFQNARSIYYAANKAFISGHGTGVAWPRTVPASAEYVRVSINSATTGWDTLKLEKGAVSTDYEPYGFILDTIHGGKVFAKNLLNPVESSAMEDPVIAPIIYLPRQKEIIVYNENVNKFYEADGKDRTRIEISGEPSGMKARGFGMVYKQSSGTASLTALSASIKIYSKEYEQVKNIPFTIQPVDQTVTTPARVMNLGDSFTLRSAFCDPITEGVSATGLTFHGMRRSAPNGATRQVNCEGRGGWLMSDYHTTRTDLFSPFRQPVDPYKFYGPTQYWISAVNGPLIGTFPLNYDWGNIEPSILAMYSGTTGLLLSPNVNDVMYVNADSAYKRWTGSAWEVITSATLSFSFNFAKYRSLYGCPAIDVLHVLLGTNDFSTTRMSTFNSTYTTFKSRMDTILTSFKADNPAGKFIVGTPTSSGRQGTYETERRKLGYWLTAQALIRDYAGRELTNVFLADYHSVVSRDYAFPRSEELPFDQYAGDLRVPLITDTVHESLEGYYQMGNIYMGTVQKARQS